MNTLHSLTTMVISLLFLLPGTALQAQPSKVISLPQLQQAARDHYPALKQKEIYRQIAVSKADALHAHFLPQIDVAGKATYQSEVTKFDFDIPDAPSFKQSPDQYSLGLEVREDIFDYGRIRMQSEIEMGAAEIQSQQVEVDFQNIKERINQLYGMIFLQQENKGIMQLRITELDAKRKKVQSAVNNGAALQSSFLVLESEHLSTQQKIAELNSNLERGYKTLTLLTGLELDSTYTFQLPKATVVSTDNLRPEFKLFQLQENNLSLRELMIHKNNLPQVFAFGNGYIGRPGFNFLNNNIRPYGILGLGLNWNLSAYYTDDHQRNQLQLNQQLLSNQQEVFELNLTNEKNELTEEIANLENLITLDAKIVEAKTTIRKASSSQLDNGIITSSDYITDLNAENQAQFNLKLHEIQLIMAKENYNTILGH